VKTGVRGLGFHVGQSPVYGLRLYSAKTSGDVLPPDALNLYSREFVTGLLITTFKVVHSDQIRDFGRAS
jgi:hypothetical protein